MPWKMHLIQPPDWNQIGSGPLNWSLSNLNLLTEIWSVGGIVTWSKRVALVLIFPTHCPDGNLAKSWTVGIKLFSNSIWALSLVSTKRDWFKWQFQLWFPWIMMNLGLFSRNTLWKIHIAFFFVTKWQQFDKTNTGSASIIMRHNALATQHSHPKIRFCPWFIGCNALLLGRYHAHNNMHYKFWECI
jgi:hypothetical protein